ncbi:hypothetical protein N9W34_00505 [Rickettsiales bacterium]|nr:hypothetical protein [Rickettsiales bacterium]
MSKAAACGSGSGSEIDLSEETLDIDSLFIPFDALDGFYPAFDSKKETDEINQSISEYLILINKNETEPNTTNEDKAYIHEIQMRLADCYQTLANRSNKEGEQVDYLLKAQEYYEKAARNCANLEIQHKSQLEAARINKRLLNHIEVITLHRIKELSSIEPDFDSLALLRKLEKEKIDYLKKRKKLIKLDEQLTEIERDRSQKGLYVGRRQLENGSYVFKHMPHIELEKSKKTRIDYKVEELIFQNAAKYYKMAAENKTNKTLQKDAQYETAKLYKELRKNPILMIRISMSEEKNSDRLGKLNSIFDDTIDETDSLLQENIDIILAQVNDIIKNYHEISEIEKKLSEEIAKELSDALTEESLDVAANEDKIDDDESPAEEQEHDKISEDEGLIKDKEYYQALYETKKTTIQEEKTNLIKIFNKNKLEILRAKTKKTDEVQCNSEGKRFYNPLILEIRKKILIEEFKYCGKYIKSTIELKDGYFTEEDEAIRHFKFAASIISEKYCNSTEEKLEYLKEAKSILLKKAFSSKVTFRSAVFYVARSLSDMVNFLKNTDESTVDEDAFEIELNIDAMKCLKRASNPLEYFKKPPNKKDDDRFINLSYSNQIFLLSRLKITLQSEKNRLISMPEAFNHVFFDSQFELLKFTMSLVNCSSNKQHMKDKYSLSIEELKKLLDPKKSKFEPQGILKAIARVIVNSKDSIGANINTDTSANASNLFSSEPITIRIPTITPEDENKSWQQRIIDMEFKNFGLTLNQRNKFAAFILDSIKCLATEKGIEIHIVEEQQAETGQESHEEAEIINHTFDDLRNYFKGNIIAQLGLSEGIRYKILQPEHPNYDLTGIERNIFTDQIRDLQNIKQEGSRMVVPYILNKMCDELGEMTIDENIFNRIEQYYMDHPYQRKHPYNSDTSRPYVEIIETSQQAVKGRQ